MKGKDTILAQGNEACVWGALAAGCRFFAGYPITPASEIAELMSRRLPEHGGIFMQMEDEIASISAVIGAAWGGLKACTATSGPGFSLMQEGLGYAAETETPCVIINVMRGGPSTGQPTLSAQQDVLQAKYGSHGDYEIIAFCPASIQEAFELTIRAFNAAERFRVPVIVLSDEIIGHTREILRLFRRPEIVARRPPRTVPGEYVQYRAEASGLLDGMPAFGQGYRLLVDGQLHDETGNRAGDNPEISGRLMARLCRKVTDQAEELTDMETYFLEDPDTVVVAYGSVSRSALSAVRMAREQGLKAGLIRPRILWPFPDRAVAEAIKNAGRVIVPEMNIGKMVREVRRLKECGQVVEGLSKLGGNLFTPYEILEAIRY
ncbi:MAG: 2-oxoacid:acceptor oxidoreductase subunit alpha [Thermodesulfobacteriota bacterium]